VDGPAACTGISRASAIRCFFLSRPDNSVEMPSFRLLTLDIGELEMWIVVVVERVEASPVALRGQSRGSGFHGPGLALVGA
jgi:hypothetical protein